MHSSGSKASGFGSSAGSHGCEVVSVIRPFFTEGTHGPGQRWIARHRTKCALEATGCTVLCPLEPTGYTVPIGPLARNGRPPGKIELTTGMGGRASPHQRSKLNSSGRVEKGGGGNHKIVSSFVVITGFSPLSDSKLHLNIFPSRGGRTIIFRVAEPDFRRCHFSIQI